MKKLAVIPGLIVLMGSCKKDTIITLPPSDNILYINLYETAVKKDSIKFVDLDQDATMDIAFGTLLVGDPVNKLDKLQFYIMSFEDRLLFSSLDDRTPVYAAGDIIPHQNTATHDWNEVLFLVLSQKNTSYNPPPYWTGDWRNASHRYIGVQVEDNMGLRYSGWIEISFAINTETLILHRSGISKIPAKDIKAGY